MNDFTVGFDMSNAVFDEGRWNEEAALILESIARNLRDGFDKGKCFDSNGDVVGSWGSNL